MRVSLFTIPALFGLSQASPIQGYTPHCGKGLAPLHAPSPPPLPDYDFVDRLKSSDALPFNSFHDALATGEGENRLISEQHIIPNSYIVRYKDHVQPHHARAHKERVASHHASEGSSASAFDVVPSFTGFLHDYVVGDDKIWGYSGHFSDSLLDVIRAQPEVAYVERDSVVYATKTEKGAPWGLARLSHRNSLSFGTFSKYDYEEEGGEGVDAYVIDTGINIDHVELEGRASWGKTIPDDADEDSNGHGSHVAGTIASKKYGVAKKAHVIAVKVLGAGGSGSMSDVVAGVSWAATAAKEKAKNASSKHKGSVANMSLGGGKSQALDDVVDAAVDKGLHFAVAAGNDNRDACTFSPAASKNAITVGASDIQDSRAYFSNHGKCVDVFGPGLNILSIWNSGNSSVNTISGTSMASPHLAGLLAYYLSLYPHTFTPTSEDYEAAGVVPPSKGEAVLDFVEESLSIPSFLGRGKQMIFESIRGWTQAPWAGKVGSGKPDGPLSPKVLKHALIRLGTRDVLTDLPEGTPNVLAFNNYTSTEKD